jgi:hypothetical protein
MAAEGYRVQISGNIGNALYVILGDDVAEVEKQAEDLKEAIDRIYESLAVVQQTVLAKEVFSAKQNGYQKTGPAVQADKPAQAAPQRAASNPAGPTPSCAHGEMEWKDFVSKQGKAIKGHFCQSSDRDDQCPPKWKR